MKRKENFVIITLLLGTIILLCILPLGHDLWYHLYRIGAMAVELKENPWNLPIRILSDTYNGYGYGAALYYGDAFLYLPALLVALGMDIVLVYKLFTVSMWLGCFGIAFYSAKLMGSDKDGSLLFAYVYTLSSGFILNLCIRSAVGETLAMLFLPLVFASFYCLIYKKENSSKYWLLLSLSMGAVAVSHMISLFWCGIILCVWAIVEWKKIFEEKKWIDIVKAAVFMIGLTASFLFPMFEQMLYQKVQTAGNNEYQKQEFMNYGLTWIDYFMPYDVKKILVSMFDLTWDIEYWRPGTVGLLGILLLGCVVLFRPKMSKRLKMLLYGSIGFLVALGIPSIMNVAKEIFSFMQFSWRILPFVTLGLAICAWMMAENEKNSKMEWMIYIGSFLIAITIIVPRYGYQILLQANDYQKIREDNSEVYEKYQFGYDKNAADCMYLPENVWGGTYEKRGEVVEADKEGIEFVWKRTTKGIVVDVKENPYEQVSLEFPLYIYKGYVGVTEEGTVMIPERSEDGLVCLEIGAYEGELQVSYKGTMCQKISDLITILTMLTFAISSCRKRKSIL